MKKQMMSLTAALCAVCAVTVSASALSHTVVRGDTNDGSWPFNTRWAPAKSSRQIPRYPTPT